MAQAGVGLYTFVVDQKANKPQISEAIKKQYTVTPVWVRTSIVHGKVRRSGKKMQPTRKPNWKKAVVTLVPGQKIDAFEVRQEEVKK